jgi:cytochrome P450
MAANRDPAQFSSPDDFDPVRPGLNRHVAFGAGPHNCLGQHLARIEAVVLVREIVTRIPNLRLMEVPRYGSGRARHLERMLVCNK